MEKRRSDTYAQLAKIVPWDVGLEKVLATCRFPGKKQCYTVLPQYRIVYDNVYNNIWFTSIKQNDPKPSFAWSSLFKNQLH
jgi:hypothetical protein